MALLVVMVMPAAFAEMTTDKKTYFSNEEITVSWELPRDPNGVQAYVYHEGRNHERLHYEIIFGKSGNFTFIPEHSVYWHDGANDGVWIIELLGDKIEITIIDHDPQVNALEDIVKALESQNTILKKFYDNIWKQGFTAGRDSCTG